MQAFLYLVAMKFIPVLLLISVSALAQQKDKPVNYLERHLDSLDLDFDWKRELYNMWDCYCPWLRADSVRQMPRELHPYQWDKSKLIVIDDSTYQQWIKSDLAFKKMYHRADSIQRAQDSVRVKKKPVSL
jgi:hypothetical protein